MPSLLLASRFFVRLLVFYGLAAGLWGLVASSYASCFQAAGTAIFRTTFRGGVVGFQPTQKPTNTWDTDVVFRKIGVGAEGRIPFGTRYLGYAPMCMILSLVLASPIPLRRRCWALFCGLAIINVWCVFCVFLMILDGFSGENVLALYHPSSGVRSALSYITETVTVSTVTRYAVPTFFWILVTFRDDDLQRLRPPGAASLGSA